MILGQMTAYAVEQENFLRLTETVLFEVLAEVGDVVECHDREDCWAVILEDGSETNGHKGESKIAQIDEEEKWYAKENLRPLAKRSKSNLSAPLRAKIKNVRLAACYVHARACVRVLVAGRAGATAGQGGGQG